MKNQRGFPAGEAGAVRFQGALVPLPSPCGVPDEDWIAWNRGRCEAGRAAIEESFAAVRRTVRAVFAAAAASVKERFRARFELLGSALFLSVILFIFHRLWSLVAGEDGLAGGFTVAQLTTYLLVTEVVVMSPGHVQQRIGEDVRSGAFTIALLRPLSYVQWEVARSAGATAARALTLAAAGFLTLLALDALPVLDPRGVILGFGLMVPAALLVELCARIGIGLAAFWMEESQPLFWIWQKLVFVLGGLFLPLELYPDWLRAVCAWLPFRALLHGPGRTVTAFEPHAALSDALVLAAWAAAFATGLAALEAVGRRRVQANGG